MSNAVNRTSRWLAGGFAALAITLAARPSDANLLANGSFEQPVAMSGLNCGGIANCQGFNISDPIGVGAWTAVGPGPTNPPMTPIIILTNLYNENGYFFQPEDGNQSVDLTGMSNQGLNGVEQTFATTPGASYSLSFWVGHHAQDPQFYNGPASVTLDIDGSPVGVFSNNNVPPPDLLDWEQFTDDFIAAGATTTIDFFNAISSTTQNEVGLDNVVLTAVPEPGSAALLAAAVGFLGWRRRRAFAAERFG
jgi:PEP-CTERM motif-containing protein